MTPEEALEKRAQMERDGFCVIDDILTGNFLRDLRVETESLMENWVMPIDLKYQGQHVTTVTQRDPGRFAVISGGLQGPVGTVAEDVLARAESAEKVAAVAADKSDQTAEDVSALVSKLNGAFAYYAGVIEA